MEEEEEEEEDGGGQNWFHGGGWCWQAGLTRPLPAADTARPQENFASHRILGQANFKASHIFFMILF